MVYSLESIPDLVCSIRAIASGELRGPSSRTVEASTLPYPLSLAGWNHTISQQLSIHRPSRINDRRQLITNDSCCARGSNRNSSQSVLTAGFFEKTGRGRKRPESLSTRLTELSEIDVASDIWNTVQPRLNNSAIRSASCRKICIPTPKSPPFTPPN